MLKVMLFKLPRTQKQELYNSSWKNYSLLSLLRFAFVRSPISRLLMLLAKFTYGGHHSLFLDFNSLLSRWRPITLEETLDFVKKVKARDHGLYLSLFAILCQKNRTSHEVYEELVLIFQNHDDLLEEVTRFRPPSTERMIGRCCSLRWLLFPSLVVALSWYLTSEKSQSYLLQNPA